MHPNFRAYKEAYSQISLNPLFWSKELLEIENFILDLIGRGGSVVSLWFELRIREHTVFNRSLNVFRDVTVPEEVPEFGSDIDVVKSEVSARVGFIASQNTSWEDSTC